MDTYSEIARKIIQAQKAILGPVALSIAGGVSGLDVHDTEHPVFTSDPKKALTELVTGYSSFFGDISVEVCKEAAHDVVVKDTSVDLPEVLK